MSYKYPMQYLHSYICSWQLMASCFVEFASRLQEKKHSLQILIFLMHLGNTFTSIKSSKEIKVHKAILK